MQAITNILTSSRVKSFVWRFSMMFLAGGVASVSQNIAGFELGELGTVIFGLILGEVSKAINSKLSK